MKKLALFALIVTMVLAMSSLAFAQDDDTMADDDDTMADDDADDDVNDDADDDVNDDADDDSGDSFAAAGEFLSPDALGASEEYEFNFRVENTSNTINNPDNWICEVDLFMPSGDYSLAEDMIADPDALHSGEWSHEVEYSEENKATIMWMHSGLNASSSMVCDIHEGEALEFSFRATTDEGPTDGFDWRALSAGGEWATDQAFVSGDDDDDDTDDDDVDAGDDDDDDDDGCGC